MDTDNCQYGTQTPCHAPQYHPDQQRHRYGSCTWTSSTTYTVRLAPPVHNNTTFSPVIHSMYLTLMRGTQGPKYDIKTIDVHSLYNEYKKNFVPTQQMNTIFVHSLSAFSESENKNQNFSPSPSISTTSIDQHFYQHYPTP